MSPFGVFMIEKCLNLGYFWEFLKATLYEEKKLQLEKALKILF